MDKFKGHTPGPIAAAPELLAENERLKHELAAALFDNERLRVEVKLHEQLDADLYLAAQLNGTHP